jgi:hypothetical protein
MNSAVSRTSTVVDTTIATAAPSAPIARGLSWLTMPLLTTSTSVEMRSVTSPTLRSVKNDAGNERVWRTIRPRRSTANRAPTRAMTKSEPDHARLAAAPRTSAVTAARRASSPPRS